jgi:hypothetical protein
LEVIVFERDVTVIHDKVSQCGSLAMVDPLFGLPKKV